TRPETGAVHSLPRLGRGRAGVRLLRPGAPDPRLPGVRRLQPRGVPTALERARPAEPRPAKRVARIIHQHKQANRIPPIRLRVPGVSPKPSTLGRARAASRTVPCYTLP